jgi:integrase
LRDYALLTPALQTGRRASELAGLCIGDLVRDGGRVVVLWRRCKGGKQMQDELSPRTAAALLRYLLGLHGDTLDALDPTTPVWPSLARNAVQGENGISVQAIADLCTKRMGTSKIHALRHTFTFAHAMEASGAKVSDIQARLGHESLATTGRYLTALKRASNPYAERLEELFGVE